MTSYVRNTKKTAKMTIVLKSTEAKNKNSLTNKKMSYAASNTKSRKWRRSMPLLFISSPVKIMLSTKTKSNGTRSEM